MSRGDILLKIVSKLNKGEYVYMKDLKNKKYYTISIYTLATLAAAAVIIKLIWYWGDTSEFIGKFFGILSPFIWAWFIAYLINPLVELLNRKVFKGLFRIKRKGISKTLSILVSYVLVISIITTCMFYIIPQIVQSLVQLEHVIDSAQTGYNSIIKQLNKLNQDYPQWNLNVVVDFVKNIPEIIGSYIGEIIPTILPKIYDTSLSVIFGVINALIAIIVSVYMLFDKHKLINNIKKTIYAILPEKKADKLLVTSQECNKIFGNFIIGKAIDSTIIGFLCWIITTAFNIPYPLVISVIVGVTNMIPYFGPFIGAVPGILLLIIVDPYYAVIFTIIIFLLQQFDGLYLGPRILGESTGLRPIWIIFAISLGGWVAGVIGMFLGVPVTAVIAFLLDRKIGKRLKAKNVKFEADNETEIISRENLITEDEKLSEIE